MIHALIVLLLAAGTPTPKAKSTPKPAAKTTRAKATPKATPVKPDEPVVSSGERALTKGEVTYKLGKEEVKLADVKGSIQASSGYQIATVAFTDGKKQRLQLDFMFVGTGPVDQLTSLYALDESGASSAYKKGVSTCTVTLDEATPTTIAGVASCPKGMLDLESKPAKPVIDVKFRAAAE